MAYKRRYYRRKEEAPIDVLFDMVLEILIILSKFIGEILFQIFKFVFDRRSKIKGIFKLNNTIVIPEGAPIAESIPVANQIKQNLENFSEKKYSLKNSQITASESNFLAVLQEVVGNEFIISTQVPISSIVSVNSKDYVYFNKIKAKTIDYVLFTKDRRPYLAIELDDRSHFRWDRRRRDEFVNNLMDEVGLRLLRVKASYSYNPDYIRKQIFS